MPRLRLSSGSRQAQLLLNLPKTTKGATQSISAWFFVVLYER